MTIHDFLKNKKILLLGLGRQGGGSGDLKFLLNHHYTTRVTDRDGAEALGLTSLDPRATYHLGIEDPCDIDWCDLIIVNPAVADSHPLLVKARTLGKPYYTSIALFVAYSPIPCIGVTGTRGKTTTTTLLYEILNRAYPNQVLLGGNIPGSSGLFLFDKLDSKKYVVLELSSFQLHSFHALKISPSYAIITNLYPDHLNRYSTMQQYQADKEAIVTYMLPSNIIAYNADNPGSVAIAAAATGKKIPYTLDAALPYPTQLPGAHNQSNIAASVTMAQQLGVNNEVIRQVVASFTGVNYRQQVIADLHGVTYINDTTATTPTATIIALRAQTKPTILICGGESKNIPHEDLHREITNNEHVKKIVILGSHNLKDFTNSLYNTIPEKILGQFDTMNEAVMAAKNAANPGDVVLLSPGFSSFDLFKNEFDRGDQFNLCINNLTT